MVIQIKINDIDVSDYVISCENIPVIYRNRNWEPVAKGFGFNVTQKYTTTINADETVEVLIDNVGVYLGFVESIKNNDDDREINIKVNHYLNKLYNFKIKKSDLYNGIVLCGDFTGAKTFAPSDVDTGNDLINCVAHGVPIGAASPGQFNTTGTLPAPLLRNHIYYLVRINDDQFDVQFTPSGSALDLTTQGTGTHSFTQTLDLNKYIDYDNENSPNTAIWWVLSNMFILCGMTLDTSNIDATVLYSENIGGTDYDFTFDDFVVDVNMLFALNQVDAKVAYTDSEVGNFITFQDFVFKILGIFGFAIKYNGNTSNKQFSLYPYSNTPETINDDFRYKYTDQIEYGITGIYGYENWAARTAYQSSSSTILDEQANYSSGDYEDNQIPWWTNLKIYFRKQSGTPDDGDIETTTYYTLEKASTNQINAFSGDYLIEEVKTIIGFDTATVKENYLDIQNRNSIIVQETKL
jgi:hypothetical protein